MSDHTHKGKHFETRASITPLPKQHAHPLSLPIVTSSTYTLDSVAHGARIASHETTADDSPWIYSRWGNPTTDAVASQLCDLEQGERTFLFSSGMAAISTVFMSFLNTGDHVIAPAAVYGGSHAFLRYLSDKYKVEVTFLEEPTIEAYAAAVRPETKLLYAESPANPILSLIDLAALAALGKQQDIVTACDNTFGTPYNQPVLPLGIDIALHSATKYLGGHSDLLAGAVTVSRPELIPPLGHTMRELGNILNAHEAFLLSRGLKTLAIRMRQHNSNCMQVATFLQQHPFVIKVNYPGLASHPQHALAKQQMIRGFGGMLSFEVQGGVEASTVVAESVRIIHLGVSLGGVESLICPPAAMTHANVPEADRQRAGISAGLIRLSVGLEDAGDLIEDLSQALARAEDSVGKEE